MLKPSIYRNFRFRRLPFLLALGILVCPSVQADAYRCVGAGGRVSISSVPCDGITGRRRVQCYAGTRGLLDECEMRVTGTAGLTTAQERHLRAQCRSMTGGG